MQNSHYAALRWQARDKRFAHEKSLQPNRTALSIRDDVTQMLITDMTAIHLDIFHHP